MSFKVDLIVPFALAVLLAPLQAQSTVDPSGTWIFQYGDGEQGGVHRFVLSLGDGGRVTGMVHPPGGTPWEIEEGKIDGNELILTVRPEVRARTYVVELRGVVGAWNISIPDPRGDRTWSSVLTITRDGEQYKGIYTSGGQQHAVADLGIESKRLTFSTVVTRAEREMALVFQGRPYGTRIPNGTMDVNNGRFSLGFTATLSQED